MSLHPGSGTSRFDWQFFDCMAANTFGIVPPVANLPRSENSGGGVAALQAIIASTSSRN
jgi:hypothetical protein